MDFEMYEDAEQTKNSGFYKKILIGILILVAIVGLIFLIVFAIKNKKDESPLNETWFSENIYKLKDTAVEYFTLERLPKNEGENVKLTLQEMLNKKLLLELTDSKGNSCNAIESYVDVTKLETEYQMEVYLECEEKSDFIITYLGCYDYCSTLVCEKKEELEKVTSVGGTSTSKPTKKPSTGTKPKPSTPAPTPSKPTPPERPKAKSYRYLYEKKVNKVYSEWSDWSADKEYNTSSNNIVWGKQELIWNEKNGSKTTTTYKEQVDKNKPIFQSTYDNVIGSYKQYVCNGFTYFRDSSTQTTYKTGDWVYRYNRTFDYVPTDTYNTKYVYVGMDYEKCSSTCTLKPYYIYKVYTRSTSAVTQTKDQLSATCNVVEKEIPVYGLKLTFKGYLTNRTSTSVTKYYYHTKTRKVVSDAKTLKVWSKNENDATLKSQGYVYTGIKKEQK